MPKGIFRRKKYKTKFRRSVKELKEFIKENNIKLPGLLEYIRKRNDKKIQKGIVPNVKNNS